MGRDRIPCFSVQQDETGFIHQSLTASPYYPALAIQPAKRNLPMPRWPSTFSRLVETNPQLLGWRATNRHHLSPWPSILSALHRPSPALPSLALQQAVLPVLP